MSDKRCQLCHKHPAMVHFTEVEDGKKRKLHICGGCARARGLIEEPSPQVQVQELVIQISQSPPPVPEAATAVETPDLRCSRCGLSYAAFQRIGRLGCADCYRAFEVPLVPLLRKIHANVVHAGRAPRTYARKVELRQRIDDLRQELDRAVRGEDYERAATLRDAILHIEAEQSAAARAASTDPGGTA
jgi:protein arginine kinase activator